MGYLSRFKLTWQKSERRITLDDIANVLLEESEPFIPQMREQDFGYRLKLSPDPQREHTYILSGINGEGVGKATRDELLRFAKEITGRLTWSDADQQRHDRREAIKQTLRGKSEVKWYGYHEDMIKISEEFSDIVFVLLREGEDREDVAKHYYLNGQHEGIRGEMVFGEPAMLKTSQ